jgi:hypothetical protein
MNYRKFHAGNTRHMPPSSLPAHWNLGESDAIYLAGGGNSSGTAYPEITIHTVIREGEAMSTQAIWRSELH